MTNTSGEKLVLVIRDLAQFYEGKSREIEKQYDIANMSADQVLELEARCDMLTDQFRVLQQKIIPSLDEEDLTHFVRISQIFDELRILYMTAIDSLKAVLNQEIT